MEETKKIKHAKSLMQNFAESTGLTGDKEKRKRRYLWTDAFGVFNFLALNSIKEDDKYKNLALTTIKEVHHHLGKFAANDDREGWISELSDDKAKEHPTINGLRIGKKLAERKKEEPFDEQREWDRDGQYYHYHTRWINALLKTSSLQNDDKFAEWASELSLSGDKFIEKEDGSLNMYWKMSVDLSHPLVPRRGAHDPLEGLLCALQIKTKLNLQNKEFDSYIERLKKLCENANWETVDALGIGGLLLNVIRANELEQEITLPKSIESRKLLRNAEQGLEAFYRTFKPDDSANYRLPFRECGLSLGLRCLNGNLDALNDNGLMPNIPSHIWSLSEDIENFWLEDDNIDSSTYQNHLDINEVSIAASLLASQAPDIYSRL